MLVWSGRLTCQYRRPQGDTTASLTDYDGKEMEWLFPRMEHLLDLDASNTGKFIVSKNTVNNACHSRRSSAFLST